MTETQAGFNFPDIPESILKKLPEDMAELLQQMQDARSGLDVGRVGGQAKGVAWGDLYGKIKDDDGVEHEIHFGFAARSELHPAVALIEVLETIKIGKAFNLIPYPTDAGVFTPKRGKEDPDAESDQPSRGRRSAGAQQQGRRRGAAGNGSSGSASSDEGWYKVLSIELKADKGRKWLQVRLDNPGLNKFGLPSYLDSGNLPGEVLAMIESGNWQAGDAPVEGSELQSDFSDMQYAYVSGEGKSRKITGWSETQQ